MERSLTETRGNGQLSPGHLPEHPEAPSFDPDFGKILKDFRNKLRDKHHEQWD